jgi:transcriptional regulator with XRE-family HTH domain
VGSSGRRTASGGTAWSGPAIAERLTLTRLAISLTQAEFARRAGIGYTTYNNYELEVRVIPYSSAAKLCEAYRITMDWIYRGDIQHLKPMLQNEN